MKDVSQQDLEVNLEYVRTTRPAVDVPLVIAGPCRVESLGQIESIAGFLAERGVKWLRAGAYKPCTFPSAPPGLAEEGVLMIEEACRASGMKSVSEVMAISQIEFMERHIDVLQVGARNMQNYDLLRELGKTAKPVLLKRHPGASLRDFLGAAEWVMSSGNEKVILCERGVSAPHTHDPNSRWLLDLTIVPALRRCTNLPVVVDPSHACGLAEWVPPLAKAALAVGADGVMVEVHPTPEKSVSDPLQTLDFEQFAALHDELRHLGGA